jgi:hypothetical protein
MGTSRASVVLSPSLILGGSRGLYCPTLLTILLTCRACRKARRIDAADATRFAGSPVAVRIGFTASQIADRTGSANKRAGGVGPNDIEWVESRMGKADRPDAALNYPFEFAVSPNRIGTTARAPRSQ